MFDFFGLSRELCDCIYKASLAPEKWVCVLTGLAARNEGLPATNLLLVNRQCREEYLASSARRNKLTFVDVANEIEDLVSVHASRLHKAWRTAAHVDFRLWVGPHHPHDPSIAVKELEVHVGWIDDLLADMQHVKSVAITGYIPSDIGARLGEWETSLRDNQQLWATIPRVQTTIFALTNTDILTDGPGRAEIVLEWDKKTGALRPVDQSVGGRKLDAVRVPAGFEAKSDATKTARTASLMETTTETMNAKMTKILMTRTQNRGTAHATEMPAARKVGRKCSVLDAGDSRHVEGME